MGVDGSITAVDEEAKLTKTAAVANELIDVCALKVAVILPLGSLSLVTTNIQFSVLERAHAFSISNSPEA